MKVVGPHRGRHTGLPLRCAVTRICKPLYVNELRVGLACKLLAESDAKITEIACEAGFNNLSNFNRQFLKFKQVSPKAYRQQYPEPAQAGAP
ncbi:MAG: helix-turn-helix domain-containing protein [Blastocatellia bacterium]